MKKILLVIISFCLLLTGCDKVSQKSLVKDLEDNTKKGYKLEGELSISNNDEIYNYEVKVSYKKDDYYKVELVNTLNDHKQVILKNDEGVFVLTPGLNKSFRFQSNWPYNNSQIYLLDRITEDIKNDKNSTLEKENNKIIVKTKVNYPNNSKLINQKITFKKSRKIDKVSVYDKDGIEKMNIKFKKINYSPKFSKDEFKVDEIANKDKDITKETGKLEDVIYPLVVPNGTKLVNEEKVKKENGERVIMNYDGEKSFLLVEETAETFSEFTIIPTIGEPFLLTDTLGVMTSNSLSWTSGGVDYYLVSDVMDKEEMIEIAESMNGTISVK